MKIRSLQFFNKKAKKLLSEDSLADLLVYLTNNPEAGDIIPGSNGLRKLRWATGKNNKGKSGGARIIYYYLRAEIVILITMYIKSEQKDLSAAEREEIKRSLPLIIKNFKEED